MNLGSLLRSAAFFGVEGVICEHGCAKYSAVAAKASAGAGEMVQLLRVSKLQSLLPRAKEQGWCVVGAALPDPEIDVDFSLCGQEGVLLLLGPEGPGLRRRLKQLCDRLVGISRVGDSGDGLDSLNAGLWDPRGRRRRRCKVKKSSQASMAEETDRCIGLQGRKSYACRADAKWEEEWEDEQEEWEEEEDWQEEEWEEEEQWEDWAKDCLVRSASSAWS
eukprot:g16121.t1